MSGGIPAGQASGKGLLEEGDPDEALKSKGFAERRGRALRDRKGVARAGAAGIQHMFRGMEWLSVSLGSCRLSPKGG